MPNKIDSAIGSFWGASFFIGLLVSIIMGFNGNGHSDWVFSIIVGMIVFLCLGLIIQGILTLFK